MGSRRHSGTETMARLLDWQRGSAAAERLAGQVLRLDGFTSIDPAHPLGGPDGMKDIVCQRGESRWIAAAYFPVGQKPFSAVKRKLLKDSKGVPTNNATGIAFVSNQKLTQSNRDHLIASSPHCQVELYHLERIASALDAPAAYGVRLEFLDIEMTKEEQLAFIAERDKSFSVLSAQVLALSTRFDAMLESGKPMASIPIEQMREFKALIDGIVGSPYLRPMSHLEPPLAHLREFAALNDRISGLPYMRPMSHLEPPLDQLREFKRLLDELSGSTLGSATSLNSVSWRLSVPVDTLKDYEKILDRVLRKQASLAAPIRVLSERDA